MGNIDIDVLDPCRCAKNIVTCSWIFSRIRRDGIRKERYMYSKHPHIRTHDFGGQADRVLI